MFLVVRTFGSSLKEVNDLSFWDTGSDSYWIINSSTSVVDSEHFHIKHTLRIHRDNLVCLNEHRIKLKCTNHYLVVDCTTQGVNTKVVKFITSRFCFLKQSVLRFLECCLNGFTCRVSCRTKLNTLCQLRTFLSSEPVDEFGNRIPVLCGIYLILELRTEFS